MNRIKDNFFKQIIVITEINYYYSTNNTNAQLKDYYGNEENYVKWYASISFHTK